MADYETNEILRELLAEVPDTLDKREGSVIYTTLQPSAVGFAQQNFMVGYLLDLLYADTASAEWLDRAVYDFGFIREQATQALRKISTTDSGGEAFDIALGSRFAINNLTFRLTERIEQGQYKAMCEQPGTVGNLYGGTILPVDNINGLGSAVLDTTPLIPARDTETDEALRERFYAAMRRTPYGGNIADYELRTLAVDGVGAVKVFAAPVMGGGNVGLVIGDELGNKATAELVRKVQSLMGVNGDGIAPCGHIVTVTTSVDLPINVAVQVRLKTGVSLDLISPMIIETAQKYIDGIAFTDETVFHSKLMSAILNCSNNIMDCAVTLNGAGGNIALTKTYDAYQVPTVGTVIVTGVTA